MYIFSVNDPIFINCSNLLPTSMEISNKRKKYIYITDNIDIYCSFDDNNSSK